MNFLGGRNVAEVRRLVKAQDQNRRLKLEIRKGGMKTEISEKRDASRSWNFHFVYTHNFTVPLLKHVMLIIFSNTRYYENSI